jgi:hypothetical protein
MAYTKKELWVTGGVLTGVVLGSYFFYRKSQQVDTSQANNILQATTPTGLSDDANADAKTVIGISTSNQGANLASSFSRNYANYNFPNVVDLHTGASTGNGNSLDQGTRGEIIYQSLIQSLVASDPVLAPTASATAAQWPPINWETVLNPPLPN